MPGIAKGMVYQGADFAVVAPDRNLIAFPGRISAEAGPARGVQKRSQMNATDSSSPVDDYFEGPICTEEAADLAYRNYVSQGSDAGSDFGQRRDAQAWSTAFLTRDSTAAK
jgi:hypothetical protein